MKFLITGGAGFIGAHVAQALVSRGEHIVILDDLNSFLYPGLLKELRLTHLFKPEERPRLINGTILDSELLEKIFAEEKFDRVIHLAAHANPGFSIREPEAYSIVNIVGTLKVLETAVKHDIVQFIFAGSSSVYDDQHTPFQEEAFPLAPPSPYGVSKAAAEMYCNLWHATHSLPVTVLRFFSVYGPWGRPDMAPMIFARQLLQDQPLYVTQNRERDFTYIDDAVAGVMAAIDHKFPHEVINIGRGQPLPLLSFINALEKAVGKKASIRSRLAPAGEMQITYADISKARRLLGYEPKVTVEEGAARLADWLKQWGDKIE